MERLIEVLSLGLELDGTGSLAHVIDCIIVQQIPPSPQLLLHRRCLLLCSKIIGSVYDIDFGQWNVSR